MGSSLLRAGRLDRRVTILRPVTVVDAAGEAVEGSVEEVETWASVQPAPGTERFANAENAASAPMRFVMRWREDLVRVTDRIRHDGHEYAVLSVSEIGRREGVEALASARVEAV